MRRLIFFSFAAAALAGGAPLAVTPARAQISTDRILDIYGDEKCPASNGQQIVVCRRHPAEEKYRIPKDLRDGEQVPQRAGGNANAVAAVNSTGQTGVQVNSCNTIGAGVSAGCTKQGLDNWKAQQRAQKKAEDGQP